MVDRDVERFWTAIEDPDPSSMAVALDIALEHDQKIWKLAEDRAWSDGLYDGSPKRYEKWLSVGRFEIDTNELENAVSTEPASVTWYITDAPKQFPVEGLRSSVDGIPYKIEYRYKYAGDAWAGTYRISETNRNIKFARERASSHAWVVACLMKRTATDGEQDEDLVAALRKDSMLDPPWCRPAHELVNPSGEDWRKRFWEAIRDPDPSSMDVARDLALEHEAKIWELGEQQALKQGLYTKDTLSVGTFSFDFGIGDLSWASVMWTVMREAVDLPNDLEMTIQFGIDGTVWRKEFSFSRNDTLRDVQRTAAEVAWGALTTMKNFVAEHGGYNLELEDDLKRVVDDTTLLDSGWGRLGTIGRRGGKYSPPIELVNPSTKKTAPRARDEDSAVAKYREFNSFDPKELVYEPTFKMPTRVQLLGDSVSVQYRSRKVIPDNGVKPRSWVYYTHDHSPGCYTYGTDGELDTEVPSFIVKADALTLLGECVGFAWKNDEGAGEGVASSPYPELYTTPCGRALLVIQNKRKVLAMSWGGRLGVEDRGIVG